MGACELISSSESASPIVVSGADVLDIFTVRTYGDTGQAYGRGLRGLRSAQTHSPQAENPQVTAPRSL